MKKRAGQLLLLLCVLSLLLGGCRELGEFKLFKTAEELYAPPALPEDYAALEATIQTAMSQLGAEYAAPTSGSNTATVQLLDMDGDNTQESAAVFFRVTAADAELPLKIYFLRKGSDGSYRAAYVLEGEGNTINSIAYEDLTGDGRLEVVVSWQLASGVYMLSVYALGQTAATEMMYTTYNKSYTLYDLDEDGCKELVVFSGQGPSFYGEHYDYDHDVGGMTMRATVPLSANVTELERVNTGPLTGMIPALYVTSTCPAGQVVDILALEDGLLANITRDEDSGVSSGTMRIATSVEAEDLNGDGVPELPSPVDLPRQEDENAATYNRVIYWRQYDRQGEGTVTSVTYHCQPDGWYLFTPREWATQMTVERNDTLTVRGERAVEFYHVDDETGEREKFLTIYRLTGENRTARAMINNREVLESTATTVYAAEFFPCGWDCGLTMEGLAEQFELITQSWSSG